MNHNPEMLNLPSKKEIALVFRSKFRNFVEFGMNLCFTEI